MSGDVSISFDTVPIKLPIAKVHPVRTVTDTIKRSRRYKQIEKSVTTLGLVEPVVVVPEPNSKDTYILLDGHLRLAALKAFGAQHVDCLVSTDDEGYTYNRRIARLKTVHEHFMILEAVEKGISEDRIAEVLGVDVSTIRKKRDLLKGICREAVNLIKDQKISVQSIAVMRRVKPMRQIEMAELMSAANNFRPAYAKAILAATSPDQLNEETKYRPRSKVGEENRERMERELATVTRNLKRVEEDYGENMVKLVMASGYLSRMLSNEAVYEVDR